MKILLGLFLMAIPCFGMGWLLGGKWKDGFAGLGIFLGLVCFAAGMHYLGFVVIK